MHQKYTSTLCKRILLYSSVILASLFVLDTALFAQRDQGPSKEDLLPENKGDPPWYQQYLLYAKYPQAKKLQPVEEVTGIRYDYEKLIKEIMRKGVLEEGWQRKVLRVKGWIPKKIFGVKLDAYVYRQNVNGCVLHICDTRPCLVIVYSKANGDFTKTPQKTLRQLLSKILKVELPPGDLSLNQEKHTKMYQWSVVYGGLSGENANRGATSKSSKSDKETASSFCMHCSLGKDVLIVKFQKSRIAGCVLNRRYPLFKDRTSKARDSTLKANNAEIVLKKLDKLKEPKQKNIPELIRLLSGLPKLASPKQAAEKPYDAERLFKAKTGVLKALAKAVNCIRGKKGDLELVESILKVSPSIRDMPRDFQLDLKQAIGNALKRIGTDASAALYRKMVEEEKDKTIRGHLMKEIGKIGQLDKAKGWSIEKLRAVVANPDKDPGLTVTVLLYATTGEFDRKVNDVVCQVYRKTKNANVRKACIDFVTRKAYSVGVFRKVATEFLLSALKSGNKSIQGDVILSLGKCGSPLALKAILPLLSDNDSKTSDQVAKSVALIFGGKNSSGRTDRNSPETPIAETKQRVKDILEALDVKKGEEPQGTKVDSRLVRNHLRTVSAAMPSDKDFSLEKLQLLAQKPDEEPDRLAKLIRSAPVNLDDTCLKLVGKILTTTKKPQIQVACMRVLTDSSNSIMQFRNSTQPVLKAGIGDKSVQSRQCAAMAMAWSSNFNAVDLIYPLLSDKDMKVRIVAAKAICFLLQWPSCTVDASEKEIQDWIIWVEKKTRKLTTAAQQFTRE